MAVIGAGHWGRNLVRNFSALGALSAVCDKDSAVRDALELPDGVRWETDPAVLFSDPCIHAVAIATPAATHGALTRQALDAGKHVFVEKPLCLDLAEAEALGALADRLGRALMVGHLLLYHPAFDALSAELARGGLGALRYVYSTRASLGRIRREENALWSFAPHDVSMILALTGAMPDRVFSAGGSWLHPPVADTSLTHLTFPGNVQAHVFVSWLHPYKDQRLVVVGSDGMAVFNDVEQGERKLLRYAHTVGWNGAVPAIDKAAATPLTYDREEPLTRECAHFLDCVASGRRPRSCAREAWRVLSVLDACQRSLSSGRGIRPAAESRAPMREVFVHPTASIDEGATVGADTRIWHFCHVMPGARIGPDCVLGQNVMVGPGVRIGRGVKVQNNVSIYAGVTLEDDVFCGPSCVFTNVLTPRAFVDRKDEFLPTLVQRGATIGANATIVCGVTIGRYATIGAGAVVTRDVADHSLVFGNPARHAGWVSRSGDRLDASLVCPRTGERYRELPAGTLSLK